MRDDELWHEDKTANGWEMPFAPWWKRLPVIRHFRTAYHAQRLQRHETFWRGLGRIPRGYDRWVIYGIARGYERARKD